MFKKCLLFLFMLSFSFLQAQESLDTLMGEFNRKNDLSQQTKKESYGHVTVFTRQDIESLRLYSLKELIEYIDIINYNETNYGLSDPTYSQATQSNEQILKFYLDNQSLSLPHQGIGLKYYGYINLHFIDHIEIYWGSPSFSFGLDDTVTVVKLYSKEPSRENITTVGAQFANSGSSNIYGYSAHKFDDFSYLLSADMAKIKQKKFYKYENFPLSRDQETHHVYSNFHIGNSKFTFSVLDGQYDGFVGESLNFKPYGNNVDNKQLYLGWDYTLEDDLKLYAGYNYSNTNFFSKIAPNSMGVMQQDIDENSLKLHLVKRLTYGNHSFDLGYHGVYEKFNFNKHIKHGVDIKNKTLSHGNKLLSSLYLEDNYFIDSKNLLIVSFKYSWPHKKKNVKDDTSTNFRIGYIHHEENWYNKIYSHFNVSKADTIAEDLTNYNVLSLSEKKAVYSVANEIGYKTSNAKVSLIGGYVRSEEKSLGQRVDLRTLKAGRLNVIYAFNGLNRLRSSAWIAKTSLDSKINTNNYFDSLSYGGHLSLMNSIAKFDLANTLHYTRDDVLKRNNFNYTAAVSYRHSKNLEFFLKGTNLLGKARKNSPYYGFDERSGSIISIRSPLTDKTIWLGVEYSF